MSIRVTDARSWRIRNSRRTSSSAFAEVTEASESASEAAAVRMSASVARRVRASACQAGGP